MKSIRSRRAAVLICVMACCLVAIGLAALSVHLAMFSARHNQQLVRLRQTEWLLQAGVQRAQQALEENASYPGELWRLPDQVLNGQQGEVAVEVSRQSGLVNVIVTAWLGDVGSSESVVKRSHQFVFQASGPPLQE